MENNLPMISKRVWNIVRVAFFMLQKGFTKPKLMMNLNLILKRPGKLAGKAIAELISLHHHHHHGNSSNNNNTHLQFTTTREYEFSCSNTPKNTFFSKRHHFFTCAHAPHTLDDDVAVVNNALKAAMKMMDDKKCKGVVEDMPRVILGSGPNKTVRPVRVTDSPFPVVHEGGDDGGDHQVDMAAEEFIERMFKELRTQG